MPTPEQIAEGIAAIADAQVTLDILRAAKPEEYRTLNDPLFAELHLPANGPATPDPRVSATTQSSS